MQSTNLHWKTEKYQKQIQGVLTFNRRGLYLPRRWCRNITSTASGCTPTTDVVWSKYFCLKKNQLQGIFYNAQFNISHKCFHWLVMLVIYWLVMLVIFSKYFTNITINYFCCEYNNSVPQNVLHCNILSTTSFDSVVWHCQNHLEVVICVVFTPQITTFKCSLVCSKPVFISY